ncbi:MAG: hypothetical protein HYW48_09910 [Deltaproteobacteria bacterium]|nr:hypothetical protein [Deltaproteobacteria bacterium]
MLRKMFERVFLSSVLFSGTSFAASPVNLECANHQSLAFQEVQSPYGKYRVSGVLLSNPPGLSIPSFGDTDYNGWERLDWVSYWSQKKLLDCVYRVLNPRDEEHSLSALEARIPADLTNCRLLAYPKHGEPKAEAQCDAVRFRCVLQCEKQ